jgi:hypothetical protein
MTTHALILGPWAITGTNYWQRKPMVSTDFHDNYAYFSLNEWRAVVEGRLIYSTFATATAAKARVDEMLIDREYVLCKDEDELDKYRLLV